MSDAKLDLKLADGERILALGAERLVVNTRVDETREGAGTRGGRAMIKITRERTNTSQGVVYALTDKGVHAIGSAQRAAKKGAIQLWRVDPKARTFMPWRDIPGFELDTQDPSAYAIRLAPSLGRRRTLQVFPGTDAEREALADLAERHRAKEFTPTEARAAALKTRRSEVEKTEEAFTAAIQREPYLAAFVAASLAAVSGLPTAGGLGMALLLLATDVRRDLMAGNMKHIESSVATMLTFGAIGAWFAVVTAGLLLFALMRVRRRWKALAEQETLKARLAELMDPSTLPDMPA